LTEEAPPRRSKSGKRKRGPKDPVSYTVESIDRADASDVAEAEEGLDTEPGVPPERKLVNIDEDRIDPDASKVVRRLVRHGYEAYLVGGCVRDLLLNKSPKDFDVATSARPEAVRRLFRNSRIIGRRFRLVHVLYGGGKVIETATFRRNPSDEEQSDDLLIRNDNTFGVAHEDAARRDFTINALFYDLDRGETLDWCGGMRDIERRAVRTIGDPIIRFREDPIRMLRAIKFSARLDLGIDPDTYHALVQCRETLELAAKPRLFEEILRLLRGGAAHRSIWLSWETGILDVLLPELSSFLYDRPADKHRVWGLLDQIDFLTRGVDPVDDITLLALLLFEPMMEACDGRRDRVVACEEFVDPMVERLAVPRRIADALLRIVAILPKLANGGAGKFSRTPLFPIATQILDSLRRAADRPVSIAPPPSKNGRRKKRGARKRRGSSEPHAD
jgi:poly(A) polymerase